MAKEQEPGRRTDAGLSQPNLGRAGERSLIRMLRREPGETRGGKYAFITRHPAVERINPFGDPYELDCVRLTWLDAVKLEQMLAADDIVQNIGKKMAEGETWSKKLEGLMRAAVQRVFETKYLPWLQAKFDESVVELCAEFMLVSIGEQVRGKAEAAEWRKSRKHGSPGTTGTKKRKVKRGQV